MSNEDYLAERLYELRTRLGVSARVMSKDLKKAPGYINNIENKKALPSMKTFFQICEYLGVTVPEFYAAADVAPPASAAPLREMHTILARHHVSLTVKFLDMAKWIDKALSENSNKQPGK